MLPDFLPSALSEEDSVAQHAMGNKSLAPRKAELFVFGLILDVHAGPEKVIHIVDERVHILLIKSGKI
ncbi:MAG: hypothetical protein IH820_05285 [Bacteroidetes bacterium]|nr:hypothetical protein [Bacteroidota bacterium]